jgi:Flp pilus assembly pilin Flp
MFAPRHPLRDDRGLAAVEFAMIAPVMIMMICGFMEYAHVSSARTTLESATMRAARAVVASDCPSKRQAIMMNIIEGSMKRVPSANGGQVEVITKSYSDKFGDVGESEPFPDPNGNGKWDIGEPYTDINANNQYDLDMGKVGSIGGVGQVVSYTARYQVSSLFEFISKRFNGTDKYMIEASTVVRNEPIFRSTGCT